MSEYVKPILALDFDGVLNSYKSGFGAADVLPDPPVEGSVEACYEYAEEFSLHVHSARCIDEASVRAVQRYLRDWGYPEGMRVGRGQKPQAKVYIDDRGFQFNGKFPSVDYLVGFKPWYERDSLTSEETKEPEDESLVAEIVEEFRRIGRMECPDKLGALLQQLSIARGAVEED